MELRRRYQAIIDDFEPVRPTRDTLRVNELKMPKGDVLAALQRRGVQVEAIEGTPYGYEYHAPFNIVSSREYLLGYIYLQGVASMLPVLALQPEPGDLVIDMTAAPGSKTTQIAQHMDNQGVILAADNDANRLRVLRNNLERLGVSNVVAYKKNAEFLADLGYQADKILLDAPCTGNYCQLDDFFKQKTVNDVRRNADHQLDLFDEAIKLLKPGGTLVYSTCSLEPEENEFVIHHALQNYDVELVETELQIGEPGLTQVFGEQFSSELAKTKRLWPHRTNTEGFFVAKIRKNA